MTAGEAALVGLPPWAFQREDERPDASFYAPARLVTHIDDGAIEAVRIWRTLDDAGHAQLVEQYLKTAGWGRIERLDRSPARDGMGGGTREGDPLFAVVARWAVE